MKRATYHQFLRARLWLASRTQEQRAETVSSCGKADLGVAGHAPEAMDAGIRHPVQVVCHRTAGHFALHTTSA